MFGFELCDIIKKSPLLKGIGVILIASIYDKTRYKRAPQSLYGADDYIERHHIEDELLIKVQRLLNSLKRGGRSTPSEVSQSVGASERREGQMASRIGDARLGNETETTRRLDSLPSHRSQDNMDEITLTKHSRIVNPSHPTGETVPGQKQVAATGNSLAHDAAKRLARIIISDIALYNQKSVEEGLREGNFADRLKGELDEGRRLYRERVSREVLDSTDFFEEAIREFIHNRMPTGK
jgi:response regulator RpfG family c-di-GMP phosphodiesterase